jgi:hypothetical protein
VSENANGNDAMDVDEGVDDDIMGVDDDDPAVEVVGDSDRLFGKT